MIDDKELRKGNLVYGLYKNIKPYCVCEILSIVQHGCDTKYIRLAPNDIIDGLGFAKYEEMSGIPITAEILKRFGFDTMDYEYDVIEWGFDDEHFGLTQYGIPVEDQPFTFNYEDGYADREVEIKYVHQLQNLYYALIGKELELKESMV